MTPDEKQLSASADGIRQCLRLLADEAAALKLRASLSAIEKALAIVLLETSTPTASPSRHRPAYIVH
jgi:hypothetical protein